MFTVLRNVSATNAHNMKTNNHNQHITALNGLQELREMALNQAIKYRWDPVIGRAHDEYLNLLNRILEECEV